MADEVLWDGNRKVYLLGPGHPVLNRDRGQLCAATLALPSAGSQVASPNPLIHPSSCPTPPLQNVSPIPAGHMNLLASFRLPVHLRWSCPRAFLCRELSTARLPSQSSLRFLLKYYFSSFLALSCEPLHPGPPPWSPLPYPALVFSTALVTMQLEHIFTHPSLWVVGSARAGMSHCFAAAFPVLNTVQVPDKNALQAQS